MKNQIQIRSIIEIRLITTQTDSSCPFPQFEFRISRRNPSISAQNTVNKTKQDDTESSENLKKKKQREREEASNLRVNAVGTRGSGGRRKAKSGTNVGDGRVKFLEGKFAVFVRVELVKLMVDERGEDVVVANQLHNF